MQEFKEITKEYIRDMELHYSIRVTFCDLIEDITEMGYDLDISKFKEYYIKMVKEELDFDRIIGSPEVYIEALKELDYNNEYNPSHYDYSNIVGRRLKEKS